MEWIWWMANPYFLPYITLLTHHLPTFLTYNTLLTHHLPTMDFRFLTWKIESKTFLYFSFDFQYLLTSQSLLTNISLVTFIKFIFWYRNSKTKVLTDLFLIFNTQNLRFLLYPLIHISYVWENLRVPSGCHCWRCTPGPQWLRHPPGHRVRGRVSRGIQRVVTVTVKATESEFTVCRRRQAGWARRIGACVCGTRRGRSQRDVLAIPLSCRCYSASAVLRLVILTAGWALGRWGDQAAS